MMGWMRRLWSLVKEAARSRAAWVFAVVWLASILILTVSGQGFPVFDVIFGPLLLPFSAITVLLTERKITTP